jgi:putative ABC transport system ATP-binding protein
MVENPFILCDGLVKIYKIADLEVLALQGLDLTVQRGEMIGIVGASGSGKSTLMNILGGLDTPSAGKVMVDNINLLKMSQVDLTTYRRSKVGFVWQQGGRNLIPYLSAVENVRLPMMISNQGWGDNGKRADELLEAVGLAERRNHRLMELSGGEQQRVAIAVAIAHSPSLLLADEPTGELDTTTALGIFQLLRELNQRYQLTTLIVSHDTTIAQQVDRVVAIRDGKTSSETVRQAGNGDSGPDRAGDTFEEITLLDSAGRLQVPRDFLAHFNIQGRARLELTKDGIMIRPVEPSGPGQAVGDPGSAAQGLSADGRPDRGWLQRLWRNSQRRR